jgi:hypothetical protein
VAELARNFTIGTQAAGQASGGICRPRGKEHGSLCNGRELWKNAPINQFAGMKCSIVKAIARTSASFFVTPGTRFSGASGSESIPGSSRRVASRRAKRPKQAMYRELHEEIGLLPEHVRILGRTRDWLRYEVPTHWITPRMARHLPRDRSRSGSCFV